ncbi:MAG TPA: 50S ribosomal protein L3 [Candidatus Pacearchaeota archaeon]|nr:50S ribosomal protein L3 [Candidatus Paceibacterota bacterium]HOK00515.1 50S ribosomal protein L3 [Candidatus Pacearchaeota archaeon]HOL90358.1 50S ribosomal protein L3 [Candidatus Pacearchaeota archaeon]HPO68540.1 50S ribosomal protein L3 [Candidatus Pacearchaeota archaeon]
MKFILGRKLKMSQVFDENGNVIPVTLVEAGPCFITQVKTEEKDKYSAVQIGFIPKKKNIKKTEKGKEFYFLKEFKCLKDECSNFKIGDKIDVNIFEEGDKIKVSGISKGKGYQGVIKRWDFKRKPGSHGTKHEERAMGSTGSRYPQRVIKGRKMPGRTGSERITIKNLKIIKIDKENNILAIKGAVPGAKNTLLEIKQ